MTDRVPKTRVQAASRADRLHELLLLDRMDEAREAYEDLAEWFEEGES